ncbi:MAG: hypothetical protein Q4D41_10165 [Prevotellaceae bacterium]|nr:hypothetical protein [Prevotellaceae bacterium]
MKRLAKYMFLALTGCLAFASCSDDDNWSPGEQDSEDKAGVYFSTITQDIEVDPEDATEIELTICRLNTSGSLSVPLTIEQNDSSIFVIPSSAEFADGESETTIKVTYPDAVVGTAYTFMISIPEEYISLYKEVDGGISNKTTITRVKWEDVGVGYWIDGNINTLYGVETLPLAVDIQKAVSGDGNTTKYRFNSPFAYVCTSTDEYGYIGYPYNEEADCDNEEHKFIITVTGNNASLAPVDLGMDWGYGMFSVGSIYGNLSDDIETYPLGVYSADNQVITFSAGSLYVSMADYGTYVSSNASYLYLSGEAYAATLSGTEE